MEQCDNEAKRKRVANASRWPLGLNPAELAARQDLYNGFGNGLALAFEIALIPAIFGLMGYGLDRWLGTLPLLMIAFVLLAVAGLSVRQFAAYTERMKIHEGEGPWAEGWSGRPPPAGTDPDAAATAPQRATPAPTLPVAVGGPTARQRRRHAQRQVTS